MGTRTNYWRPILGRAAREAVDELRKYFGRPVPIIIAAGVAAAFLFRQASETAWSDKLYETIALAILFGAFFGVIFVWKVLTLPAEQDAALRAMLGKPIGLPMEIQLSGFSFANYAGFWRKGMRMVAVDGAGKETITEDKSLDSQMWGVLGQITNLNSKPMTLEADLVLTIEDGKVVRVKAGTRGWWGKLGVDDIASVNARERGMEIRNHLEFPLTINAYDTVSGTISFIAPWPREFTTKAMLIGAREQVEIRDIISGASVTIPVSGKYRGSSA